PSWGERLRAMRNVPPFLRLIWETHRGYLAGIAVLRFLRAFIPIASLWVGKLLVDAIVFDVQSGEPRWRYLATLVGIELGIVVLGEVAARTSALLESLLGDLFANR